MDKVRLGWVFIPKVLRSCLWVLSVLSRCSVVDTVYGFPRTLLDFVRLVCRMGVVWFGNRGMGLCDGSSCGFRNVMFRLFFRVCPSIVRSSLSRIFSPRCRYDWELRKRMRGMMQKKFSLSSNRLLLFHLLRSRPNASYSSAYAKGDRIGADWRHSLCS